MKGEYAFCPKSGAPLSEERHYDERGRPARHPVGERHDGTTRPDGELTGGALRSSRVALFNHFRNCHRRAREPDEELYSRAGVELLRLKRTASGRAEWDLFVWYALAERLSRTGWDVEWMGSDVEPRCPDCAGDLRYESGIDGEVFGYCAVDCTGSGADRLAEIRDRVADLYRRAFADAERIDADGLRLL
ncbi:hypothetical protein [Halorussus sp. AFM4]|uniref:hypothetical protein n=1 Tax=Halorussus sp. AFM4 TaxID=3421651 RepID=UPI003EBE6E89